MTTMTRQDGNWTLKAQELYEVSNKVKFFKKQEKKVKEELISLSRAIPSFDDSFEFKPIVRKGGFDYEIILGTNKIDLKEYDKPEFKKEDIFYWKLHFQPSF